MRAYKHTHGPLLAPTPIYSDPFISLRNLATVVRGGTAALQSLARFARPHARALARTPPSPFERTHARKHTKTHAPRTRAPVPVRTHVRTDASVRAKPTT